MKSKKYCFIAMIFGFAESAKTSWLIYSSEFYFNSKKELLDSLTEYLYQKYLLNVSDRKDDRETYKTDMAKCCRDNWSVRDRVNPPSSCPRCNANYNLPLENSFDVYDWHQYLFDLQASDANSYGYHDEVDNQHGWSWFNDPFNTKEKVVVIRENAEHILTQVLDIKYPELMCTDSSINQDYIELCKE